MSDNIPETIIVFVTAGSINEAREIGKTLVDERLVACCNIMNPIESIFQWQGKVTFENEALMICKTKEELFERVADRIRQLHSYEVPEIIAAPIVRGSNDYLNWVRKETLQ
ncbi:divalent-cation tolerance protein CutA [Candidatus Kuenenia sp.]|uniref:divalent-cation tolerance protein CutA n=1 Tax=Candidatus Kuenenia sp. TaxID=2499824 RepID=UPI00321FCB6E